MTRLADDLLRQSLGLFSQDPPVLRLCEREPEKTSFSETDAA
jgi:hypothetical protein